MSDNNKISPEVKQTLTGSTGKARKQYRVPQLEALGDLRTLTLGGSPGIGDSGTGKPEFPPGVHAMTIPFPLFNPNGSPRLPDDPPLP